VSSTSLRKSHVTPKVSKVEMDVGNMKFRGRKSSSGKSSVGSCSNSSYEAKFVSKQQREKITDKNRCNPGNKSKTSSITAEGKGKGIIIEVIPSSSHAFLFHLTYKFYLHSVLNELANLVRLV
jgi:hypothetical protein